MNSIAIRILTVAAVIGLGAGVMPAQQPASAAGAPAAAPGAASAAPASAPAPAASGAAPSTAALAASNNAVPANIDFEQRGPASAFWRRYEPWTLAPPPATNTGALAGVQPNGSVYLSLHDMLQMALANDLDIAAAGYNPLIAQTDYFRTLSGGASRGVAGSTLSTAAFSGSIGSGVSSASGGSSGGTGSVTGGSGGVHGGGGSYEPTLYASWDDEHARTPLNSSILFGTDTEDQNISTGGVQLGQSFTTGTGYSVTVGSTRDYINSTSLFFNPEVASFISIGVSQNLLAGSSRVANRIFILAAQNSQHYADAVFRERVVDTVAAAAEQYWALVAAQGQLSIATEAEANAARLVDETQDLVHAGRAPDLNLIQARTQYNSRVQARLAAADNAAKQASRLKNYLAKQWTPNVISARLVATDALPQPAAAAPAGNAGAGASLDGLIERAVQFSPALEQSRWNLQNSVLVARADRNELLPSFGIFASYTADGLSGVEQQCATTTFPCPSGDQLTPIPGGLSKSFKQVFDLTAPDYGVGFSLTMPVFNREARADQARAELELAQARVNLQDQTNQVSQQVDEDNIELTSQAQELQQALAAEDLARQSLDGEENKYRLGTATVLDVATAENALADAENQATTVRAAYANALVELAKVSGTLLDDYHVVIEAPGAPPAPPPAGTMNLP